MLHVLPSQFFSCKRPFYVYHTYAVGEKWAIVVVGSYGDVVVVAVAAANRALFTMLTPVYAYMYACVSDQWAR